MIDKLSHLLHLPFSQEVVLALRWYTFYEPQPFPIDEPLLQDPQKMLNLWKWSCEWGLDELRKYMEVAQSGYWSAIVLKTI